MQAIRRPITLHLLTATHAFQGLSGLVGGLGLMVDPSGTMIGLPAAWLEGSPFADYFIPGVILFSVLGVLPSIVSWGVWTERAWSRIASLCVGIALVGWIVVEIIVVGYQPDPPLQFIYGLVGLVIIGLSRYAPRFTHDDDDA